MKLNKTKTQRKVETCLFYLYAKYKIEEEEEESSKRTLISCYDNSEYEMVDVQNDVILVDLHG